MLQLPSSQMAAGDTTACSTPLWKTLRGPQLFYDLHELAESLPGLEKYRPKVRRVEEVGLGRNVSLFDHLRHWAYRNVRQYKGGGLSAWNAWLSLCNTRALVRNGDFPYPLDGREVWHVAKSVAKWTYQKFDIQASDARFSKTQAYRGGRGGTARSASYESLRADARLMAARGLSVTDIARELNVSRPSVYAWLKD